MAAAAATGSTPLPALLQRVIVAGREGTVRFAGSTKFAAGAWVGIELDEKVGKNSGTVQGVTYFSCPAEHGIFVRPNLVQIKEGEFATEKPAAPTPALAAPAAPAAPAAAPAAAAPAAEASPPPAVDGGKSPKSLDSGDATPTSDPAAAAASLGTAAAGGSSALPAVLQRVVVAGCEGTVRFAGPTKFAAGSWVGVELDEEVGKNSGTVQGVTYFSCKDKHGIFVRPNLVQIKDGESATDAKRPSAAEAASPKAGPAHGAAAGAAHAPRKSLAPRASVAATSAHGPAGGHAATGHAAAGHAAPGHAAAGHVAPGHAAAGHGPAGHAAGGHAAPGHAAAGHAPAGHAAGGHAAAGHAAAGHAAPRPSVAAAGSKAEGAAPRKSVAATSAASLPSPAASADSGAEAEAAASRASASQLVEQQMEALRQKVQQNQKKIEEADQEIEKERGIVKQAEEKQAEAQRAATADKPLAAKATAELQAAKEKLSQTKADVEEQRKKAEALELAGEEVKRETAAVQRAAALAGTNAIKDMREELKRLEMAENVEELRALELRLELEELELQRDEERLTAARASSSNSVFKATSQPVAEYQSALRVLAISSQREQKQLREMADNLEKDSEELIALKRSSERLSRRRLELQESIAEMERQTAELGSTLQVGISLEQAQKAVLVELQEDLDGADARVAKLEAFVTKLHKDRCEIEADIAQDAARAAELSQQVQQHLPEGSDSAGGAPIAALLDHASTVAAEVRRRKAALSCAAAATRAACYVACIPTPWRPELKEAGGEPAPAVASTGGSIVQALAKVARTAQTVAVVEKCFCKADALTTHICTRLLPSLPPGSEGQAKWLCALCLVSGSCAAAASVALSRLKTPSEASLPVPKEIVITEKEGNLGLSFKGGAPQKSLLVQKVLEGSLAARYGIRNGSTVTAVDGKFTERMSRDVFTVAMKKRPLRLLVRPPQERSDVDGSADLSGIDAAACSVAQAELDKLLAACKASAAEQQPQPEALQKLQALEEEFLKLQRTADALVEKENVRSGMPRAAVALALRRMEAIYRFGLNVAAPQDTSEQRRVLDSMMNQLSHTATRIQRDDAAVELAVSSGQARVVRDDEEDLLSLDVWEKLSGKLKELETSVTQGASSDVAAALEVAAPEVTHLLTFVAVTWPHHDHHHPSAHHAHHHGPVLPPAWTSCAFNAQSHFDEVFEAQRLVTEAKKNLAEMKEASEDARQRLAKERERRAELQSRVDSLRNKCEECSALDEEAASLHTKSKKDTAAHADLAAQLDRARTSREEQERASRESASKLASLEHDLEERRRKPTQELEGRATALELATLRHTSVKGARNLYAMQVDSINDLAPLPELAATRESPTARSVESCVSRFAELRRELLFEWTRTRVDPFPDVPDDVMLDPDMAKLTSKMNAKRFQELMSGTVTRIQHLQLQLSELKAAALPLAEGRRAAAPARTPSAALPPSPTTPSAARRGPPPAVEVRVELHCPRWAIPPHRPIDPIALSIGELNDLHAVLA